MYRHLILLGMLLGAVAGAATICCNELQAALPSQVFFSGGNSARAVAGNASSALSYDILNTQRWSQTSVLAPTCIFRPLCDRDVAIAVRTLVQQDCPFAVKSGGHNPNPGANDIAGGVSIDLGGLSGITLNNDGATPFLRLGTGATWGQVYEKLKGTGYIAPGGLCSGAGVGGVALGGGQSIIQPRVGWVADNVLRFEVVLASGEIVHATQNGEYADLYRALKGGASNFGIVTAIDLAVIEEGNIWAGVLVVPASPAVANTTLLATSNLTTQMNSNPNLAAQIGFVHHSNGTGIVQLALANTGGGDEPDELRPFQALEPRFRSTMGIKSVHGFSLESDAGFPYGYRDMTATITFVNDPETILRVHAITLGIWQTVRNVTGLEWVVMYSPQPKITDKYAAARGGNVLGLSNQTDDLMIVLLSPRWHDAAYDSLMSDTIDSWVSAVTEATSALGKSSSFVYLNFARAAQDPLCTYGSENLAFLRRVSAKYDATSVFQRLLPGGFKLNRACGGSNHTG